MTTTINRYRGDTKPIVITCQSGGSPMNLTGCSGFRMTADPLESPSDSANNIFSLDGTILSAIDGTVEFLPSALQTNYVGTYFFDVQFLDARALVNTAGKGQLIFEQDISK